MVTTGAQKLWSDAVSATDVIADGNTILVGGFGEVGLPQALIDALLAGDAADLTIVANNAGTDAGGIADLLRAGRIRKIICSYPRGAVFMELYQQGRVELELVPQGTLAERIRAGGAGIGPFYSPVGVGTPLANGKESRTFDGRGYTLEQPIRGDVALIRAHRADDRGNLVYRATARNFNPIMVMAARATIVQVREMVEPGQYLDPESVVTPGIFVDRIVIAKE